MTQKAFISISLFRVWTSIAGPFQDLNLKVRWKYVTKLASWNAPATAVLVCYPQQTFFILVNRISNFRYCW